MSRIEASNHYRFEILGEGILQELVIFYSLADDDEERKYGIPINGISNTLNDSHVSEWIAQLYNKLWVSDGMLYDLAKQIKRLSPQNNIDWIKTFFMVEKYNYLKQNAKPENDISAFAVVRSEIEHSRELANDRQFIQRLTEQITERLNDEKLI